MSKSLKIVSLPVDRGGCGWYRVRQPFEMIKQYTEHDTYIIESSDDGVTQAKALAAADICVVRQGGESAIHTLKELAPEFAHLKFVLDIDDNIEAIDPYSQHYEEYGLHDFFDKETLNAWLWKTGEGRFDKYANRSRVLNLFAGMKEADLVTVTTERLAQYARQFNPHVVVLPNAVDFDKWWKLPFKEEEQLRIGWSGGVSHYQDWYTLKEPLNRLLRKYKFKIATVGAHFDGVIDEDLRKYVEVHPWVPFEAHSWHMMAMNLDIAIIPLAAMEFNYYKSPIKLVEMSALGIPSLVSDIPPYSDYINDMDVEGYKTPEEFEQKLEQLILDADLRRQIGTNALDWAKDEFDAKKLAHLWTDAYDAILK